VTCSSETSDEFQRTTQCYISLKKSVFTIILYTKSIYITHGVASERGIQFRTDSVAGSNLKLDASYGTVPVFAW
jgi:hypothetical protein